MAFWVADHRRLTRLVFLVVGAALVAILATGVTSGDNRWYNYLQLPIWAWVTVNFGWLLPKSVDAWRRRQDQAPVGR